MPSCFRKFLENRVPCADDEETVHYTEESGPDSRPDTPRSKDKDIQMEIDDEGFPVMSDIDFSDLSPPTQAPTRPLTPQTQATQATFLNPRTRKTTVVHRRQGKAGSTSATKTKGSITKEEWSTISLIKAKATGPTKEANPRFEVTASDQAAGKRTHVATLHQRGHGPKFAEIGQTLKSKLDEAERDGTPMTKECAKKLLVKLLNAVAE